jgi:hypothetical protein
MPRLMPLPVAAFALLAVAAGDGAPAAWLRPCAVALALYFVSRTAVGRLGRWAWPMLAVVTAAAVPGTLAAVPALAGSLGLAGPWPGGQASVATGAALVTLAGGLATRLLSSGREGRSP